MELNGIVDIDIDDFLSGVTTSFSPIPKNVVSDPYKDKK